MILSGLNEIMKMKFEYIRKMVNNELIIAIDNNHEFSWIPNFGY